MKNNADIPTTDTTEIKQLIVSFRQNGVGPYKTCADAILPKGHGKLIGKSRMTNYVHLKLNERKPMHGSKLMALQTNN